MRRGKEEGRASSSWKVGRRLEERSRWVRSGKERDREGRVEMEQEAREREVSFVREWRALMDERVPRGLKDKEMLFSGRDGRAVRGWERLLVLKESV